MNHRIVSGLCLTLLTMGAQAASVPSDPEALSLLQRAVDYYRTQGDAAFPAFSRQGEFMAADRYIFVVDAKGTLLASGGPSAVLIGRNVSTVLAPQVTQAFAHYAGSDGTPSAQSVEFLWNNKALGRMERKRVYFQKVGDRIIAAGQSLPRATAEQARQLLDRATAAIGKAPNETIKAINTLSPDYREDDLYVFVIDQNTHRYVAHGYNLHLIGIDFTSIRDPSGKPVGKPIIDSLRNADSASYAYRWKNPVSGNIEDKYALVRKAGHYLVVVGYYPSSNDAQ